MDKQSLLRNWLSKQKPKADQPSKVTKSPTGPLSPGQRRLWMLQQLHPDNPFYNYAESYRLNGKLDLDKLKEAYTQLVRQHDILRATFTTDSQGVPIQRIGKEAAFDYASHDLSHLPATEREKQQRTLCLTTAQQAFDLEKGPLSSFLIIKLAEDQHLLLVTMHHIITDKWSMRILREQLAIFYRQLVQGETPGLRTSAWQYPEFTRHQLKQTKDQAALDRLAEQFAELPPLTELPFDHPRPEQPSYRGAFHQQSFSAALTQRLKDRSQANGTTLFVYLLTAYHILLKHYTQQAEIVIGTPITNRDRVELEEMIGFNNETVLLSAKVDETETFATLLQRVKEDSLTAFANRHLSFDDIVQAVNPPRLPGVNPLFQTMFILHVVPEPASFGADLELLPEPLDLGVTKFDLTLYVSDEGETLNILFEYATDLFDEATIARFQGHFKTLVTAIVENEQQPIGELPILTAEEREQLTTWNDTAAELPTATSIHARIETIVQQQPTATAVSYQGQSLTYVELDERANQLAYQLLQTGSLANKAIGLYLEPSVEMAVGILGVLKAGGAYLPLDPAYPAERIQYLLKDAEVQQVVTVERLSSSLPPTSPSTLILLDKLTASTPAIQDLPQVKPTDLAYLIYTSGSTGQPKGVMVTHANLLASTHARTLYYPENPAAFLLLSSFSFDSSVAGIFWSLTTGGKLVLAPRRIEQDVQALGELIAENEITHTLLLPTLYDTLLRFVDVTQLQSLRGVVVAGEACTTPLIERHFSTLPAVKLFNEYGPTEATVWSTVEELNPTTKQPVPIGKPITNYQAYVMLADGKQLAPVGVPGELYIGGPGVTQGYWKRPELTEQRFVTHPQHPNERLYRTGDRVRRLPDGRLSFLGRVDRQIKLRGYRIEIDEIKETILALPGVQNAVVTLNENRQKLLAFVTGETELDTTALRSALTKQLPNYMVPTVWQYVPTFPTLPNGKTDQRALLALAEKSQSDTVKADLSQLKPAEKTLLNIWREVLNTTAIGVDDNFFDVGGDSILSIQIVARARAAGLPLSPQSIFEHQTVRALALFALDDVTETAPAEHYFGPFPLSPIQLWFFAEHTVRPHHWNQGIRIPLTEEMTSEDVRRISQLIWATHHGLRQQFHRNIEYDYWKANLLEEVSAVDFKVASPPFTAVASQGEAAGIVETDWQTWLEWEQANFQLEDNNLFRVYYFPATASDAAFVVMIAHHLIVDLVSWQILAEDFATLRQQLVDGQPLQLPAATTSFAAWGDQLATWAARDYFAAEVPFWQPKFVASFPRDTQAELPVTESTIRLAKARLSATQTEQLLSEANQAFQTTTEELLLISLAYCLNKKFGVATLEINVEHNGREALGSSADFIRSVGWHTAAYPLPLEVVTNNWESLIKSLKEQIRQVPNKGMGYGILRYMSPSDDNLVQQPELFFNYLGRIQDHSAQAASWNLLHAGLRSKDSLRHRVWEINLGVKAGQLQIDWSFSNQLHRTETVQQLVEEYRQSLVELIKYCTQQSETNFTPSDFPDADLSQDDLDNLLGQLDF
ncbi:MAG: amino acid adenylation domain-containing protein [Bacteroidota bacterium]